MNQLGINFGVIIKNVAVDMYGYNVGDEVQAHVPNSVQTIQMVVTEKYPLSHGRFTYMLRGKNDPAFKAGALQGEGGEVHLDRFAAV